MRVLHPDLDTLLTTLGISEDQKVRLQAFLFNEYESAAGSAAGMRNNAANLLNMAHELEVTAADRGDMLGKLTVEKPE